MALPLKKRWVTVNNLDNMTRQYARRYGLMQEKLDMLGITDVSTSRQTKNGTVVWRLPIKYSTHNKFIEVASFATGYVRNQNGGYSNYQLNKRVEKEDYHPEYKMEQGHCVKTGKFYKYNTRSCELIPKEIDRLEYLIGYCLKNYYVKKANEVINGDYIPKWNHEYEMNRLQNKLANSIPMWKHNEAMDLGSYDRMQCLENTIKNLQNKLKTISRRLDVTKSIADNE